MKFTEWKNTIIRPIHKCFSLRWTASTIDIKPKQSRNKTEIKNSFGTALFQPKQHASATKRFTCFSQSLSNSLKNWIDSWTESTNGINQKPQSVINYLQIQIYSDHWPLIPHVKLDSNPHVPSSAIPLFLFPFLLLCLPPLFNLTRPSTISQPKESWRVVEDVLHSKNNPFCDLSDV